MSARCADSGRIARKFGAKAIAIALFTFFAHKNPFFSSDIVLNWSSEFPNIEQLFYIDNIIQHKIQFVNTVFGKIFRGEK